MIDRLHVPTRCAALIDAPESAVRRALGASEVWIRTARAVGGRLEVAGGSPKMLAAGVIRFRPGRVAGPVLFRVESAAGLPLLESVAIRGRGSIRVGLTVAAIAAGTLATVEFAVATRVPVLNPTLRPALIRYGEMLLGIATLVAREPVRVVAAALIHDGKVLLARRKVCAKPTSGEPTLGRWEFPGGKVEPGETDRQALQRELLEELGLRAKVFQRIGPAVQIEPGVQLLCYRAEATHGDPVVLVDHDEYRWVGPNDVETVDLLPADRQLVDPLLAVLRSRGTPGAADPA